MNHAPLAVDDGGFLLAAGTPLRIDATTLLANDTDIDADPLQLASVSALSAHGAQIAWEGGQIVVSGDAPAYADLEAGQTLVDSFTYTVSDPSGLQDTATVTLQVTGVAVAGPDIDGTVRPDVLRGTRMSERLSGGNGNDDLAGLAGRDRLDGGNGDDRLAGGRGNDELWGGRGSDVFVFGADSIAGEVDRIADFKRGTDFLRLEGGVTVTGFQVVGGDTVIALSSGATVEVLGVAAGGSIEAWLIA